MLPRDKIPLPAYQAIS